MPARTCLVTGGFGFVGAWLAKALLARGDDVVLLRRDRTQPSAAELLGVTDHATVVDGDVCDPAAVDRVLADYGIDTVFHLAAQTLVPTANRAPVPTFEVNVRGTWTVLDAVRRHEVPRTVVASSDKAYGDHDELPYREDAPLLARYPYDVSKACADLIARSYWHTYQVPVAVTRFANIYGGGDLNRSRLVPEAVGAALAGRRPVIRSDGSPERDFLYVEDAAAAYLAVADALDRPGVAGQAFNAGSGTPHSVAEVVATICRLAGTDVEPDIRGTGTPSGEIDRQYVDGARIEERCGWVPAVDLEEGLRRTIEWYAAHPAIYRREATARS
jgi:CDP-glucose 4,6-dehydratase